MSNGHSLVHNMPAVDLPKWLLKHNEVTSVTFTSADAKGKRLQYRGRHPTEILALKCMDGRLHIALMSQTPLGIIQPIRNLGGRFNMGWGYLGEVVTDWVRYSVNKGRDCIVLVTYHWSRGNKHRGCRGFNYDVEAACANTITLAAQLSAMFGEQHQVVYPVRMGVETDVDAFVLHGFGDQTLDVSTLSEEEKTPLAIQRRLTELYPDMKESMVRDLTPIILGNIRHVEQVRAEGRDHIDAEHRERMLGVGRGFDDIHTINFALLVGPFDPKLVQAIATAGKLLLSNIEEGRVPDDGVMLLGSAPYLEDLIYDEARATFKARSLTELALETLGEQVPKLRERIIPVTRIVNVHTRRMKLV